MNKEGGNSQFLIGLLLGVFLGGALTLLFATKKGKRLMRNLLKEGIEEVEGLEELLQGKTQEKMMPGEEPVGGKRFFKIRRKSIN